MWHTDKLRALYQFSLFLSPYLTVTCRSVTVPYSDGLTELDGYHSGYRTLSRGCVIVSFPIYTSIPEPSIIQPYSLYILKRSKSFAVWWRCVLTQRNDEDGILIGLIELMVLSPLFAEECQGLCWLFASCFFSLHIVAILGLWVAPLLPSISMQFCHSFFLLTLFLYICLVLAKSSVKWMKSFLMLLLFILFFHKCPLFIQILIK